VRNCAIGTYAKQVGGFRAFIPNPFPSPNLLVAPPSITLKADKASRLVGKLDGAANALPDVDFFVRMFTAKDAAASAQLAGTRATIIDALEEQAGAPTAATDAADIIQYIDALEYGVERLQEIPLSAALIREVHAKLTTDDRAGRDHAPGEWRTAQNWIGGAKPKSAAFVPPPPSDLPRALADFERFLNIRRVVPLIQIGVAHAQFETIHPFADGNGRVGRILITLALCQRKLLAKPLLCLSSYFKKHQQTYCDKLNDYHGGAVAGWVGFFLDGVIETATEAIKIADRIRRLRDRDMAKNARAKLK